MYQLNFIHKSRQLRVELERSQLLPFVQVKLVHLALEFMSAMLEDC